MGITKYRVSVWFLMVMISVSLIGGAHGFAENPDTTQDAAPQNVGGLLFDVDEGVELEQGPGGSVYVRSNREYMKKKFRLIDQQLLELERRITSLEESAGNNDSSEADAEGDSQTADGRRVLST